MFFWGDAIYHLRVFDRTFEKKMFELDTEKEMPMQLPVHSRERHETIP